MIFLPSQESFLETASHGRILLQLLLQSLLKTQQPTRYLACQSVLQAAYIYV